MTTTTAHAGAGPRQALNVFLLSGVAALIYQVCWQRLLFAAFGVDIESVTIIVSTFMFGLGLGAIAGGRVADAMPERIIPLFALIELGIALFGLVSPTLIPWLGRVCVLVPLPVMALANFLLLLFPTALMGATLPMLTSYLNRHYQNVGASIGTLYCINTLGAALGALATGLLLFNYLPLNSCIYLACVLNLIVSVSTWLSFRRAP